jgi:hypothetical protein
MLSEKQLEANRANAQKSTGPQTQAGKDRSRLNATRHGLTSQVTIMPEEDMEAFNQFILGLVATLEPANVMEQQLAQSYANYQWRINRAAAIEENMFALGIMEEVAENLNFEHPQAHNAASNAKTFRADAQEFARLSMYAQRLVNQADRVLRQLVHLQSERKKRQQSEMAEAVAIYKIHRAQNAAFDPKSNGFVLTIAQIEAYIHRKNLSSSAFVAEMVERDRRKAA